MLKKALLIACLFSLIPTVHGAEPDKNPYDSPNLFGRAIWIGEGEQRFPAILTQAAVPEARGLVILLHAEGEHPEWPQVIHTLRRDLTDHGWTTLALKLPAPPAGTGNVDLAELAKKMDERLTLAINYAGQWRPHNLVLIGHGLAGSVVLDHALQDPPPHLMALVGISISANRYDPPMLDSAHALERLKLPILDISAERDRLEVVNSRKRRARATRRAGNSEYRQLVLPGAGIHFYDHEALLSKRVRSWLDARYRELEKNMDKRKPADNGESEAMQTMPPLPPLPPKVEDKVEKTPMLNDQPVAPETKPAMPAQPDTSTPAAPPSMTPASPAMPATPPGMAPMNAAPETPQPAQPQQQQQTMPDPTGPGGIF